MQKNTRNHYFIRDSKNTNLINKLLPECKSCVFNWEQKQTAQNFDCPVYKNRRRYSRISNTRGTFFFCCDKPKTSALFKQKIETLSYVYYDIISMKDDISEEVKIKEQKRVNRLVHNLTSLNGKNIQEVYALIPQEVLTSSYKEQLEVAKDEISLDISTAAKTFIRVTRNNLHMKSELSIYEKLDRSDPLLKFSRHKIRKVLLNVLHTFFVDFSQKNVRVKIKEYDGVIKIDYETIQVALYHLIDNSSKYINPNTNLEIDFEERGEYLWLTFTMESLHIKEDEVESIMEEGYSGKNALKTSKSGQGLGLFRIRQMLNLNNATLIIEPGREVNKVMGFDISINKFKLIFENSKKKIK